MALNRALVGRVYPAVTFALDGEHVRRFAHAVGQEDDFAPPTFATAPELVGLSQVVGDPELGLDFTRVVHGGQEYEWRRPLPVGDVLTVIPRITDILVKGGHEFLVIESDMRDAEGELVVLARMTVVSRGTG